MKTFLKVRFTLVFYNYFSYSKISYDPNFGKRQIQLDGEAFFDVTKNPQKPFTILTKNTATTVLGTSFNIKNEATKTIVTVFTGTGSVKGGPVDVAGNRWTYRTR